MKLNNTKRTYRFPNNEIIELKYVKELIVSDSGNHRLKTQDGKLHIVPTGWIHIEIEKPSGDWDMWNMNKCGTCKYKESNKSYINGEGCKCYEPICDTCRWQGSDVPCQIGEYPNGCEYYEERKWLIYSVKITRF